jgi:hypothetical protein
MAEQKASKRKISMGGGLKRLIYIGLFIWVVVNPLGAAIAVHNVAFWIGSFF